MIINFNILRISNYEKVFWFLSVAVFMLVLATSCSDSKDVNKVTLTVEPELGQLSKYLSVKDKDAPYGSQTCVHLVDQEKTQGEEACRQDKTDPNTLFAG